jgi:hypothetical protein
MGFRSTFTTEQWGFDWPEWFREKYNDTICFREAGYGTIHASTEAKLYGGWLNLAEDIQKAIAWPEESKPSFVVLFLHECGGITRCQIQQDSIRWSEPASWKEVEESTHDYCYGCSDINAEKKA